MSRGRKPPTIGRVERTGRTLPKKPKGTLINADKMTPAQREQYEKRSKKGRWKELPRFKKLKNTTENKT
jgi:hypothetical protein